MKQRGFVLLPVVLLISLVAVVAYSLNHLGPMAVRPVASQAEARIAEQVAQAGLEHAAWAAQNSSCGGDLSLSNKAMGVNGYSATVTTGSSSSAYTLAADQDAWLGESVPAENHGSDTELSAKNKTGDGMRTLYRFNLAAIPPKSQISSALAWLFVTGNDNKGRVNVHRITADWTEGGATWASAGNQFDAQVLAVIPAQSGSGVWVQINLTAQVQGWVNGAWPNYGIMLIGTSDAIESRYASR